MVVCGSGGDRRSGSGAVAGAVLSYNNSPRSPSILASVTNKCLQQRAPRESLNGCLETPSVRLASDSGLQVEQRRIDFLEARH